MAHACAVLHPMSPSPSWHSLKSFLQGFSYAEASMFWSQSHECGGLSRVHESRLHELHLLQLAFPEMDYM